MKARSLPLALATLLVAGEAAAGSTARFAVVIGNNHSDRADTRSLRYADDDAVAMYQLLTEAGVETSLYVALDAESRQLYPGLTPAGRARWGDLRAGLNRIEAEIRAARRRGAATTLLFFYSGHGDVAHGEGYVELEDAHLTRSLLRREVLDASSADELHLVVDACRSYFLAFEKGVGGKRRRAAALGPLGARPRGRTGYILSTSSDRESHEWEAFQGGIFSHEVRSALRGAADVNRDGSVTYAELGGFLTVANRGIRNARYRPDFVVRPPERLSDELLRWDRDVATLLLDMPRQGHMVLEGPSGERVLDVHAAEGQKLALYLPAQRPLFLRGAGGDREFAITSGGGSIELSALTGGRLRVASKGALHLAFGQLFSSPFGAPDVARYQLAAERDAARERELEIAAPAQIDDGGGRVARGVAGVTAIAAGVVGLGLSGWAIERSLAADGADQVRRQEINDTIEDARVAAGVSLGVAAGAALIYWVLDADDDEPGRLVVAPSSGDGGHGIAISGFW